MNGMDQWSLEDLALEMIADAEGCEDCDDEETGYRYRLTAAALRRLAVLEQEAKG